ncbi:MAG: hypothetical protein ACT4P5_23235 [Armatimonadota bacterium]
MMIERGEVDIAYNIPPQRLAGMKQNPQLRVLQTAGDRVLNLRLNVSLGPFTVQQLFQLGYVVERRDPDRALEYYKQAVQQIVEDQSDLWLYVEKRIAVLRSYIQGYYMHPIWFPETHVFPLSRR